MVPQTIQEDDTRPSSYGIETTIRVEFSSFMESILCY